MNQTSEGAHSANMLSSVQRQATSELLPLKQSSTSCVAQPSRFKKKSGMSRRALEMSTLFAFGFCFVVVAVQLVQISMQNQRAPISSNGPSHLPGTRFVSGSLVTDHIVMQDTSENFDGSEINHMHGSVTSKAGPTGELQDRDLLTTREKDYTKEVRQETEKLKGKMSQSVGQTPGIVLPVQISSFDETNEHAAKQLDTQQTSTTVTHQHVSGDSGRTYAAIGLPHEHNALETIGYAQADSRVGHNQFEKLSNYSDRSKNQYSKFVMKVPAKRIQTQSSTHETSRHASKSMEQGLRKSSKQVNVTAAAKRDVSFTNRTPSFNTERIESFTNREQSSNTERIESSLKGTVVETMGTLSHQNSKENSFIVDEIPDNEIVVLTQSPIQIAFEKDHVDDNVFPVATSSGCKKLSTRTACNSLAGCFWKYRTKRTGRYCRLAPVEYPLEDSDTTMHDETLLSYSTTSAHSVPTCRSVATRSRCQLQLHCYWKYPRTHTKGHYCRDNPELLNSEELPQLEVIESALTSLPALLGNDRSRQPSSESVPSLLAQDTDGKNIAASPSKAAEATEPIPTVDTTSEISPGRKERYNQILIGDIKNKQTLKRTDFADTAVSESNSNNITFQDLDEVNSGIMDSLMDTTCTQHVECISMASLKSILGIFPKGYSKSKCCRNHPMLRNMVIAISDFFDDIRFKDWWIDGTILDAMTLYKGRIPPWSSGGTVSLVVDKSSQSVSPMRASKQRYVASMLKFNSDGKYLPYVMRVCFKTASSRTTCRVPSTRKSYTKESSITHFEVAHLDQTDTAILRVQPLFLSSKCIRAPKASIGFPDEAPDSPGIEMPYSWVLPSVDCGHKFYGHRLRCPSRIKQYKDLVTGPQWRDGIDAIQWKESPDGQQLVAFRAMQRDRKKKGDSEAEYIHAELMTKPYSWEELKEASKYYCDLSLQKSQSSSSGGKSTKKSRSDRYRL